MTTTVILVPMRSVTVGMHTRVKYGILVFLFIGLGSNCNVVYLKLKQHNTQYSGHFGKKNPK